MVKGLWEIKGKNYAASWGEWKKVKDEQCRKTPGWEIWPLDSTSSEKEALEILREGTTARREKRGDHGDLI